VQWRRPRPVGGIVEGEIEPAERLQRAGDQRLLRSDIADVGLTASALPPSARISAATCSSRPASRAASTTAAPAAAKALAVAAPIPLLAPATSATLPSNCQDIGTSIIA